MPEEDESPQCGRWAGLALAALLVLGAVSRAAFGLEWDELQLLHGAWRTAQGHVPYRDFFEHHPPLMQLLLAPLVGWETELSWRLVATLRGLALALVAAVAVATARLARLVAPGTGWWAMLVLFAACPMAGKLFELRADWAALLCLLLAVRGLAARGGDRQGMGAAARAGLLGGVAVCFTQKAAVLVLAMGCWQALSGLRLHRGRVRWRTVRRTIGFAAGAALAPAALVAGCWLAGVGPGTLWDATVGINLGWPREIGWRRPWRAEAVAILGPAALAIVAILRAGRRPRGATALVAVLALAGAAAYRATPVPWEQSYLLFVAPWMALLALATLARHAASPAALAADRVLLAAAFLALLALLPPVQALRAAAVWLALGAALAWASRRATARTRRAWMPALLALPGLLAFAGHRLDDLREARGVAQLRFARATAALVPPGEAALVLWDHVLPFRPSASFHWFAHDGVLRRFAAPSGRQRDLDGEYADAVDRGRARLVIADHPALEGHLPKLRRALARRCRPALPGYAGSDAWACAPEPAVAAAPPAAAPPQAPNVVLIVVDTLRADHVGSYGYARPTTPHIDALARDGVLFEHPISQAPWTAASVASLLTGLMPSVHGLDAGARWDVAPAAGGLPFVAQRTLRDEVPTLAQVLQRHGYRTAGFVSNVYLNGVFGFDRGFDVYDDDHADYSGAVLERKRRGDRTNRRVARWLATRPPEPFFLLVHYNDPHWPYDPPPPHGAAWVAGYRGPLTPGATGELVEAGGGSVPDIDRATLEYLVGLYDGEVHFADANVAALRRLLDDAGLARSVLTVVTADHGEEFLDHGSMSHGYTLYEEQLRVPLVMHYPARLPPTRVRPPVRSIDVMPTVLDLTGIGARAATTQGTSLLPLIHGDAARAPGDAVSEAPLRGTLRAVRTASGQKLIDDPGRGRRRLFDLARDPGERDDLAAREPATVAALQRRLGDWADASRTQRAALGLEGPGRQAVVDEGVRQRLEALGYLPAAAPPAAAR